MSHTFINKKLCLIYVAYEEYIKKIFNEEVRKYVRLKANISSIFLNNFMLWWRNKKRDYIFNLNTDVNQIKYMDVSICIFKYKHIILYTDALHLCI